MPVWVLPIELLEFSKPVGLVAELFCEGFAVIFRKRLAGRLGFHQLFGQAPSNELDAAGHHSIGDAAVNRDTADQIALGAAKVVVVQQVLGVVSVQTAPDCDGTARDLYGSTAIGLTDGHLGWILNLLDSAAVSLNADAFHSTDFGCDGSATSQALKHAAANSIPGVELGLDAPSWNVYQL